MEIKRLEKVKSSLSTRPVLCSLLPPPFFRRSQISLSYYNKKSKLIFLSSSLVNSREDCSLERIVQGPNRPNRSHMNFLRT